MSSGKVRVYANYKTIDGPWGGANSFLRALETYWAASGVVEYATDIEGEYDILFLNAVGTGPGRPEGTKSSLTYREIRRLKTRGRASLWRAIVSRGRPKTIVMRTVTIEKWSYSRPWLTRRDRHVIAAMNIADQVIFQTEYMVPVFRAAGFRGRRWSIIHNGADVTMFHSQGRRYWDGVGPLKVLSCTFSKRTSKRFDIIAALSRLQGVECTHIGNWPEEVPSHNVRRAGVIDRAALGDAMRGSHVFMHPAVKDPCPNVVQEALACGLPVLYSNDSGSAELAGECGVSLDAGIELALEQIRQRYRHLVERIAGESSRFSVGHAAQQYLAVFQSLAGQR